MNNAVFIILSSIKLIIIPVIVTAVNGLSTCKNSPHGYLGEWVDINEKKQYLYVQYKRK